MLSLSRVIGHYIDNFNNEELRDILEDVIKRYVEKHDIRYISPERTLSKILRDFGLTAEDI